MNKQAIYPILIVLLPSQILAKDFNVLEFGAKADGVAKDTKAVQAAIDACTKNGEGRVIIPSGKNNVLLFIAFQLERFIY